MLDIRPARMDEFETVVRFYDELIDGMEGRPYHPRWQKGVYPAPEDLLAALRAGTLYIGLEEGRILAAMVMNHLCNEEYFTVDWPSGAEPEQVTVLHMLGVDPSVSRRGLGSRLVQYAIDHARAAGQKALRLDVIEGNLPADKLYRRFGFCPLHTLTLFYEDTGRCDFTLYELAL